MPTGALVTHVLAARHADALPLYRQAQMLARQGVTLHRSTLANWVGQACWWLTPPHDLVLGTALSSPKLFADDTTLPGHPALGGSRQGSIGVSRCKAIGGNGDKVDPDAQTASNRWPEQPTCWGGRSGAEPLVA